MGRREPARVAPQLQCVHVSGPSVVRWGSGGHVKLRTVTLKRGRICNRPPHARTPPAPRRPVGRSAPSAAVPAPPGLLLLCPRGRGPGAGAGPAPKPLSRPRRPRRRVGPCVRRASPRERRRGVRAGSAGRPHATRDGRVVSPLVLSVCSTYHAEPHRKQDCCQYIYNKV